MRTTSGSVRFLLKMRLMRPSPFLSASPTSELISALMRSTIVAAVARSASMGSASSSHWPSTSHTPYDTRSLFRYRYMSTKPFACSGKFARSALAAASSARRWCAATSSAPPSRKRDVCSSAYMSEIGLNSPTSVLMSSISIVDMILRYSAGGHCSSNMSMRP